MFCPVINRVDGHKLASTANTAGIRAIKDAYTSVFASPNLVGRMATRSSATTSHAINAPAIVFRMGIGLFNCFDSFLLKLLAFTRCTKDKGAPKAFDFVCYSSTTAERYDISSTFATADG